MPDLTEDRTATFEETLDFANAVRKAGGGNPIDALMPSEPQDSQTCLIARNLNFSCEIDGLDAEFVDEHGENRWQMRVEDPDVLKRISAALDLPLLVYDDEEFYATGEPFALVLPRAIGNVARDFDRWMDGEPGDEFEAFGQYVENAEGYTRSELAQEDYDESA